MVEDGDEIVCLRIVDKDSKIASDPSVQQGLYKEEARSLLESVQQKNAGGKAISLVLELAVGKVPETIQRMVSQHNLPDYYHFLHLPPLSLLKPKTFSPLSSLPSTDSSPQIILHAPTSLIVGTRGRSLGGISSLLPGGSVSKYCLQNSPVPVVVVRPKEQREKSKAKRMANSSKKQGYDTSVLDNNVTNAAAGEGQNSAEGNEGEAAAVAKAIGLKHESPSAPRTTGKEREGEGAPLSRTVSAKSDVGTEESPSPTGPLVVDDDDLEDVPEMEGLGLGSPVESEAE